MRKFKNLTAFAIMVAMAFCVVGCGSGTAEGEANQEAGAVVEESKQEKTEFGVGDTAVQNDVEVTLVEVIDSEGDGMFVTPEDGNIFKICVFEIVNNSSEEVSVSSLMCFDAYCDDTSVDQDIIGLQADEAAEYGQLDGSIAAGKKMKGAIVYQVPTEWEKLEVDVNIDLWSDEAMRFVINK